MVELGRLLSPPLRLRGLIRFRKFLAAEKGFPARVDDKLFWISQREKSSWALTASCSSIPFHLRAGGEHLGD